MPGGGRKLTKAVNSIVLITNGISFACQAVLFLLIGSFADYGVWRPHITTGFTLLAWGVSFGWLGVTDPAKYVCSLSIHIPVVSRPCRPPSLVSHPTST